MNAVLPQWNDRYFRTTTITPPKERNQFQWVVVLIAVEDTKPQPASVNLSDS